MCAYSLERVTDTKDAVQSVLAQTMQPIEVIVSVDNNEGVYERLRDELPDNVNVILNSSIQGLSETRNAGIRASNGDIVAFIDDDAVAEPDWLENLISPFNDPRVMAVGGESIPVWPGGKTPSWFPAEFDWTIGCTAHMKLMLLENGSVRNVTGSNMAFRSEVYQKIGFWETSLGAINGKSRGGEEANICLRIKAGIEGSLIIYEPKAVVHHRIAPARATLWHLFRYCRDEGFNRAKMRKATARFIEKPLSAELTFLRHLLTLSILGRLRRFYRLSNLAQIAAITASLVFMGTTFILGRVIFR
ncbi:glycosyltransferase family 2 protein [Chloroflexota bacterium]